MMKLRSLNKVSYVGIHGNNHMLMECNNADTAGFVQRRLMMTEG